MYCEWVWQPKQQTQVTIQEEPPLGLVLRITYSTNTTKTPPQAGSQQRSMSGYDLYHNGGKAPQGTSRARE
jgi:hypothetical protein